MSIRLRGKAHLAMAQAVGDDPKIFAFSEEKAGMGMAKMGSSPFSAHDRHDTTDRRGGHGRHCAVAWAC